MTMNIQRITDIYNKAKQLTQESHLSNNDIQNLNIYSELTKAPLETEPQIIKIRWDLYSESEKEKGLYWIEKPKEITPNRQISSWQLSAFYFGLSYQNISLDDAIVEIEFISRLTQLMSEYNLALTHHDWRFSFLRASNNEQEAHFEDEQLMIIRPDNTTYVMQRKQMEPTTLLLTPHIISIGAILIIIGIIINYFY